MTQPREANGQLEEKIENHEAPHQQLTPEEAEQVGGGATATAENQVFTSVSNVLKTRHDTLKNSIGN